MKLHEVAVLCRERFGDHILLRYRWTGPAPEPGQFVMVRPSTTTSAIDPFLARPLFAHDHDGESVSLLFEVRGRGTALLAEEGAGLLVTTPSGRGFSFDGGPVALLGGGVWVAPLRLLARHLKLAGVSHNVYLEVPPTAPMTYVGLLRKTYPDATLVPTGGGSNAARIFMNRIGDLSRYVAVYASGPGTMLEAVKRAAGAVPAQLAVRERMACANGSCHGCAVPVWNGGTRAYARSCVEGPVFPAGALAW